HATPEGGDSEGGTTERRPTERSGPEGGGRDARLRSQRRVSDGGGSSRERLEIDQTRVLGDSRARRSDARLGIRRGGRQRAQREQHGRLVACAGRGAGDRRTRRGSRRRRARREIRVVFASGPVVRTEQIGSAGGGGFGRGGLLPGRLR